MTLQESWSLKAIAFFQSVLPPGVQLAPAVEGLGPGRGRGGGTYQTPDPCRNFFALGLKKKKACLASVWTLRITFFFPHCKFSLFNWIRPFIRSKAPFVCMAVRCSICPGMTANQKEKIQKKQNPASLHCFWLSDMTLNASFVFFRPYQPERSSPLSVPCLHFLPSDSYL